jgi:hypothetical protein
MNVFKCVFISLLLTPVLSFGQNNKTNKTLLALNGQYSTSEVRTYGGGLDLITGKINNNKLKPSFLIGFFYELGDNDDIFEDESLGDIQIAGTRMGIGLGSTIIYGTYSVNVKTKGNFSASDIIDSIEDGYGDIGGGMRFMLGERNGAFIGLEYSGQRSLTASLGFNLFSSKE